MRVFRQKNKRNFKYSTKLFSDSWIPRINLINSQQEKNFYKDIIEFANQFLIIENIQLTNVGIEENNNVRITGCISKNKDSLKFEFLFYNVIFAKSEHPSIYYTKLKTKPEWIEGIYEKYFKFNQKLKVNKKYIEQYNEIKKVFESNRNSL